MEYDASGRPTVPHPLLFKPPRCLMNHISSRNTLLLLALTLLAVSFSVAQQPGPKPSGARATGAAEQVTYQLPHLEIDFDEKHVDVHATVCLHDGLLELIACTKGTKEHESIVAIDAKPTHVHAALLLLGGDPGHPARMKLVDEAEDRWVPVPPSGSDVAVSLVVPGKNGAEMERPISEFIMQRAVTETGGLARSGAFPTSRFLFAGSRLVPTESGPHQYVSDRTGNVISIVTFGDEVLCLSEAQHEASGPSPWEVDATHLPEIGSPIKLRLRPRMSTIELAAPFRDNAVLQRGMALPVWGWSQPGASVTVSFAGQTKTAVAGAEGKWALELDELSASYAPRRMVVSAAGHDQVVVENVLVGEVWLASGQSNMQWKAQKSSASKLKVEPRGDVNPIREFEVTSVVSMLHPIERAEGAWKDGDYGNYSAIALAFAHKLHGELDVPIGILNCSFSQTAIQAWVPRVGFRDGTDERTKAIYKRVRESDPTTPEHAAAWSAFYEDIRRTIADNADRVKRGVAPRAISTRTPGNLSGNRDASWLYNGRMNPVVPFALRGAIWNQGYANMGEGLAYYDHLHSLVRGWRLRWDRPELPVYFHQFYCPGKSAFGRPSIDATAEMRLGTWRARDIPHTGMASQIDISGSIHYWNKTVPGQRLALHALKNQYGRDIVADGPMFRSYEVREDKLVVSFDHAAGGLVVAETKTNADRRNKNGSGFADPKIIENGADRVALFYLAGADHVWHPARVTIDGNRVILTSPAVPAPRGVSYATGGVGPLPNLYNRALLPMTPFIYFDHEPVTRATWPDETPKIAGERPDPNTLGKKHAWRKMPLLSTQFRDNAVLQAGVPITFWGSAVHDHGTEAEGDAVIHFSFAGVEKTIHVKSDPAVVELGPGQCRFSSGREWRVTVPPMSPSAEPKTLKVSFVIDGEVAHERVCENIVVGDVWYVAAPRARFALPDLEPAKGIVRVMARKAKRSSSPRPSRYSVCVSRSPKNRFACEWKDAEGGFAAAMGRRIHEKTGNPVGIIFMQNTVAKGGTNPDLDSWIPAQALGGARSLTADYIDLASVVPGNRYYDANASRYIEAWKTYWADHIPTMMKTRAAPDRLAWGSYPTLASSVTSDAAQTYNVLVHPFTPTSVRGIVFLSSPEMFADDRGRTFGEQMQVLANAWKERFGSTSARFIYTVPSESLATAVTRPTGITNGATAVEITEWSEIQQVLEAVVR